ncbi:FERM, ARHGEF and pleckstrin domain-containing protein 1-like, partial [Hyalella azteca]|uniref:FERM, ARHGEF and pleckstrin domain-containing protein 1-like n=1 Tax=Hyalella azteca TaxID=294128 RepID=A0A8B7NKA7_HYAAZ
MAGADVSSSGTLSNSVGNTASLNRSSATAATTNGGEVAVGTAGAGRTPPATPHKSGGGKMLAVKILMLDDTYTLFQIQSKAQGAVLLEQVCRQLNLLESDYFGLEYTDGNTAYWLDLDKPINRQVCLSQVEPVLRFCVKFYTPDPGQLEEEYTRYLVALQIKRDLAHGQLVCNTNTAALLASYIVQAECGDYVEEDYPDHRYLSLYKFVPSQDDHLERKIMDNHKKHVGMTPGAADLNLLETARRCDMYGIKVHLAKGVDVNLAATHMGSLVLQQSTEINHVYKRQPSGGERTRGSFRWGENQGLLQVGERTRGSFRWGENQGLLQVGREPGARPSGGERTRGSFRYSGRTQKQVQDYVRENYVKRQPFQRHAPCVGVAGVNISRSAHTIAAPPPLLQDNLCGSDNDGVYSAEFRHQQEKEGAPPPTLGTPTPFTQIQQQQQQQQQD